MRTTLTLDTDNAVRLERIRREQDASLKDVVNEMIRRGLNEVEKPLASKKIFKMPLVHLGKPLFDSPEELKTLIAGLDEEVERTKLGRP